MRCLWYPICRESNFTWCSVYWWYCLAIANVLEAVESLSEGYRTVYIQVEVLTMCSSIHMPWTFTVASVWVECGKISSAVLGPQWEKGVLMVPTKKECALDNRGFMMANVCS